MPQLRLRHVTSMFPTASDLHGVVAVLFARLVRDDLYSIELEDGAGCAFAAFGVVEGGHAFFDG